MSKEVNIIDINKVLDKVITPEIRKKMKIFHIRDRIDYSKLTFLHKVMMKMPYSQILKKQENKLMKTGIF